MQRFSTRQRLPIGLPRFRSSTVCVPAQVRELHASSHRQKHPLAGSFQLSSSSANNNTSSTTSYIPTLHSLILDSIKASGPLPVSTYMRTALLDPSLGYYASAAGGGQGLVGPFEGSQVLGKKGDFITSPEISQVFGELLAIYLVSRWQAAGEPNRTRLIELGPGRGTLLADLVRTLARFPKLFSTLESVQLVEASPGLMALQAKALSSALETANAQMLPAGDTEAATTKLKPGIRGVECEWFPRIEAVPLQKQVWTMGVAHEFFDALPIHIFEKTAKGFREVMVDMQRDTNGQAGVTILRPSDMQPISSSAKPTSSKLRYVLSPGPTPWSMLLAERNERFKVLQPGQRVEVSPEAWACARRMAELVTGRPGSKKREDGTLDEAVERERKEGESLGGAALIVDYGDEKAFGGSFRAFKNHQIVDPLQDAGTADLTANVDFAHLKSAIATTDAKALGPMFQSHFLQALGLQPRVEALVKANATSVERTKEIESGAKRLVDPVGMGAQYKVVGLEAGRSVPGQPEQREADKVYPFEM